MTSSPRTRLRERTDVDDGAYEPQLRRLFAARGQELYGLGRRLGLPPEDSADAVQETMLRLWRMIVTEREIRDLEAYAFGTMYRVAADHHRLLRRVARSLLRDDVDRSAYADPAESAIAGSVWAALDQLPPRQRAVLYLRFRADLSFDSIGAALGISASGARSHATLAMATLRRRLAEEPA